MSAHSLSVVFPRSKAPACRSLEITWASRGTMDPRSAQLPAVVSILSFVAMLSLTTKGMPCRGPRVAPASRSASRLDAISRKSGLSSSIALRSSGSVIYDRSNLKKDQERGIEGGKVEWSEELEESKALEGESLPEWVSRRGENRRACHEHLLRKRSYNRRQHMGIGRANSRAIKSPMRTLCTRPFGISVANNTMLSLYWSIDPCS